MALLALDGGGGGPPHPPPHVGQPWFGSAVPVKFLIVLRPVLSVSVLVPVSTTDVSTVFTSGIISSVVSICSDIR